MVNLPLSTEGQVARISSSSGGGRRQRRRGIIGPSQQQQQPPRKQQQLRPLPPSLPHPFFPPPPPPARAAVTGRRSRRRGFVVVVRRKTTTSESFPFSFSLPSFRLPPVRKQHEKLLGSRIPHIMPRKCICAQQAKEAKRKRPVLLFSTVTSRPPPNFRLRKQRLLLRRE